LAAVIVRIAVSGPTSECVRLWNAPDNAAVRGRVAAKEYRHAALTTYNAGGEAGRVCYVAMLDNASQTGGVFVIWPGNLFDNGVLHDYAAPFSMDEGYLRHRLSRDPTLVVAGNGRLAEP
jgi:hypothetical protein